MWVVKLGGSLQALPHLKNFVISLADHGVGKIIIVPGGGMFAEAVRNQQHLSGFNDTFAHELALRATEIFGTILCDFDNRLTAVNDLEEVSTWTESRIPVWFPCDTVLQQPEIEKSWRITSDSLSLWLAIRLRITNLLLVKSTYPDNKDYTALNLVNAGMLDESFQSFLSQSEIQPRWCHHQQLEIFNRILNMNTGHESLPLITS